MNKKNIFITSIGILFILSTASFLLYGHGIQLTVAKKYPCIVANAKYHGGQELADANVIVRFENQVFQKGKTDKNGNFCFFPDQTGKWTVTVDDGMGHLGKGDMTIENDFFEVLPKPTEHELETKTPTPSQPIPQTQKTEGKSPLTQNTQNDTCCYLLKIILGALLILVITFILYLWKKKGNKNEHK